MITNTSIFKGKSPLDYRYSEPEMDKYLSEEGFTQYKLNVEMALIQSLVENGLCDIETEVQKACDDITTEEVYAEEDRIHHDIRALVNCIQKRVSDEAKPYVHMTATSFDISDTANAARYKDAVEMQLLPKLIELEEALIALTRREAETVQIGRTHGQHAVPITFGFAMGLYVERLGGCIEKIRSAADEMVGKFSGAVGAYNASDLFFDDPEGFEEQILEKMGLRPAGHSTQIVPPESRTRLFSEICIMTSVLANLADDMRNLQRTEIAEVGEAFAKEQVGSSTMPQKRNPINFENVKSLWKIMEGHRVTLALDQISEHQRDLTNSASGRIYVEIIGYSYSLVKRMIRTMGKLVVDKESMERNLAIQGEKILSEPLYIILASMGHPDAHEKVRSLNQLSVEQGIPLKALIQGDSELSEYLGRMIDEQRAVLSDPYKYVGIAAKKARSTADRWEAKIPDWY